MIAIKDLIQKVELDGNSLDMSTVTLSAVASEHISEENGGKIKINSFDNDGTVSVTIKAVNNTGKTGETTVTITEKLGTIALKDNNATIVTGSAASGVTSKDAIGLKNVFSLLKVTDADGQNVATGSAVASASATVTPIGIVSGSATSSPDAITCTGGAVNEFKVALNKKADSWQVPSFKFKVKIKIEGYKEKEFEITVKSN